MRLPAVFAGMRPYLTFVLLAAAMPTFAQTAPAPAPAPPAAGPSMALMDSLVSKTRLYGITKTSGRRYLCRLTSGDHGVYMAQTFHFAGPPKTEKETLPATQGAPRETTRYRTIGSGRNRVRVPVTIETPGRVVKDRTVTVKTPTTIPDVDAVKMLLSGVAGANHKPEEVYETRDILALADIKFIQELAPPAKSTTATPAAPATAAATPPVAAPANAWTMTTLWPTTSNAAPAATPAPKKRTRRSRKTSAQSPVGRVKIN